ncbi:glycosyltransferase family 4 protein [Photobacterium damselae]|uniref:glycosyltransferase family 4 protein n=1 Tax=Photobacterium damselae TaxID=38293 RepID=UPI00083B31BA|nr:glycosyltransferase family 4 protein [Photobacterium damselae]ODA22605.1 hypothetical protein A0J46_18545 [Photobacterium damselae subsp. damselae]
MKVAYITPSLEKCGPNIVLQNTISGMVKNNIECEVFYLNDSDKEILVATKKTKIINFISLYKALKDFDIIHSNGFKPDFIVFLLKVCTPLKAKIITTVHNNVYHDLFYSKGMFFSVFFGTVWSFLFSFFDIRTFLSNEALKYYWFLPFKSRNRVVYNAISTEEIKLDNIIDIRKTFNIPDKSKIIGTCANITKGKGLERIINNMNPDDNIYFFIVGDGNHKSNLEKLVKEKDLADKVKFHPFTKRPLDYISQFDVFAMPSLNEGFGLTIIESTSVGTPVICSKLKVFQELFSDMVVFIPNDSFDLKKLILYTISNKENLISIGQERIKEKYSTSVMTNTLLNIYISKLDKK